MKNLYRLIIGVGLLPLWALNASAATIYAQTPDENSNSGVTSDVAFPAYGAEIFTLVSGASINEIIWRGAYNREDAYGTPGDSFTINFYNSAGLLPGSLVQSVSVGSANRSDTGHDIYGNTSNLYEYSAILGASVDLAAGDYWISVYNNTGVPSGENNWMWFAVANGGAPHAQSSDLSSWIGSPLGTDTYFMLSGTVVPIPAAVWLFGSALLGLGWIRKKV